MRGSRLFRSVVLGGLLLGFLPCRTALALPERAIGLGFGAGIPQFVAAEAQLNIWGLFQIGCDYGLLPPGPLVPAFPIGSQSYTLQNAQTYNVSATVQPSVMALSPFVRIFVGKRDFYFQYTHTLYILSGTLAGNLSDPTSGLTFPNVISGTVTLTQWLPTISIGRLYSSKLFYFNLALGFTVVSSLTISLSTNVALPALVGGNALNQAATAAIQSQAQSGIDQATAKLRDQFPFLPSLFFSMGIYL